jgi:response regulator RpfG family c-di-GMP phosphodiesterase
LLKPDTLTPEEFAIMRTHVALGVDIIHRSAWLQGACEVIIGHHEKYDGSGYPRGLKGEAIPLLARIFAIVDVFDALVSRRPYKAPIPLEPVLAMLEKEAGSHFDPQLLKRFIRMAPTLYAQIGQASDSELQSRLLEQASHYFLQTSIANQTGKGHTA